MILLSNGFRVILCRGLVHMPKPRASGMRRSCNCTPR
uniref:Uncharacterized protein n=1 Tax=Anguilla anguilla TaxID=7936 RepID=A0A0E9TWY3_ANGAN